MRKDLLIPFPSSKGLVSYFQDPKPHINGALVINGNMYIELYKADPKVISQMGIHVIYAPNIFYGLFKELGVNEESLYISSFIAKLRVQRVINKYDEKTTKALRAAVYNSKHTLWKGENIIFPNERVEVRRKGFE